MSSAQAHNLRDRFGHVGVWFGPIGLLPAEDERAAIARIEELGYGAAWFGEGLNNREAFSHAALLLGASERIPVASGVASIWARDATASINGANTLNEAYDGRFLLGLGVSHAPAVNLRGGDYDKPLTAMREYLEAMDRIDLRRADAAGAVARGARRPADRGCSSSSRDAHGRRPSLLRAPGAHRAGARSPRPGPVPGARAGGGARDRRRPRAGDRAAAHMAVYLALPNYVNNLRRLGYDDADFADGGSDRLVDAIVAWGDEEAIAGRVREHLDAGADHVAVQAYADDGHASLAQLERLAPALLAL